METARPYNAHFVCQTVWRRPPRASPRRSTSSHFSSFSSISFAPMHKCVSDGINAGLSIKALITHSKPSSFSAQPVKSRCSRRCHCELSKAAHQVPTDGPSAGLLNSSSDTSGWSPSVANTSPVKLVEDRSSRSAHRASKAQPSSPITFARTDKARNRLPRNACARNSQPVSVISQRSTERSSSSKPRAIASAIASKPSSPIAQPLRLSFRKAGAGTPRFGNKACIKFSTPSPPRLLLSRKSKCSTPRKAQSPKALQCFAPSAHSQRRNSLGTGAPASSVSAQPTAVLRDNRTSASRAVPSRRARAPSALASSQHAVDVSPLCSKSKDVNEVFSARPENNMPARSPSEDSPTDNVNNVFVFRIMSAKRSQVSSLRQCPLAKSSVQCVFASSASQISFASSSLNRFGGTKQIDINFGSLALSCSVKRFAAEPPSNQQPVLILAAVSADVGSTGHSSSSKVCAPPPAGSSPRPFSHSEASSEGWVARASFSSFSSGNSSAVAAVGAAADAAAAATFASGTSGSCSGDGAADTLECAGAGGNSAA
mmetsp:Transcript_87940/g.247065  ORF Transcript_87940/g.247065 Transcript_87940/m.247065 type:complete len:542 (+) Transcript_87940:105-1730(+)